MHIKNKMKEIQNSNYRFIEYAEHSKDMTMAHQKDKQKVTITVEL